MLQALQRSNILLSDCDVPSPHHIAPLPVQVGMRVLLHDLRATALNGKLGVVHSLSEERAAVLLDDAEKPVLINFGNLFAIGCGPPP